MKKYLLLFGILLAAVVGIFLMYSKSNHATNTELAKNNLQDKVSNFDISKLPNAQKPEVVELQDGDTYSLTASAVKKIINGQDVKMLAYNGSIPGSIIKVKQGSEITVNFTNNIDVETTIHSHGVRLDNKFDGVPDVTQEPVKVGESFTYRIKFPDAGMYWYHPHIREDYAQELGLYGNFWVVPSSDNYWSKVNQEVPLFIDDILIENGKIASFGSIADHALMGRFGNTMLVNGETDYNLQVKKGEVVRFYVTNSANTRVFNLSIPNAKMKLVGGDNGKYEKERFVDNVIISPSERALVEVYFPDSGDYKLVHKTPEKDYIVGTIDVSNDQTSVSFKDDFEKLRINSDTISSIDPFRDYFDANIDKSIRLSLTMKSPMGGNGGQHMMHGGNMMDDSMMSMGNSDPIEWEDDMGMMNKNSTTDSLKWELIDEQTGKINDDINWKFKVGDKVKIKIYNDPDSMHPMQHPIHLHGQKFLVLSEDGKRNDNMVWKDTVLVPTGSTIELLVEMENPGTWMAHCHIAEHLESGMMFGFVVE
jgi:FtsP/CotA-like multicopper oxidase with cupredoxin domain